MTCYFRHLKSVFNELGITITKENRKEIDRAIHDYVRSEYKNCSVTWKKVKQRMAEDKEDLVLELKKILSDYL